MDLMVAWKRFASDVLRRWPSKCGGVLALQVVEVDRPSGLDAHAGRAMRHFANADGRRMELITERLRLRPWAVDDLEAFHRLWSDAQTIWWGPHETLDQTRALLSKIERQGGWWAVQHDGEIVGNVFLRPSGEHTGALELGYHFRSTCWGLGFATEAARAVLATASGEAVEAPVVPDNTRSQRVLRKLGFAIAGQLMHAGQLHDLWRLES